MKYLRQSTATTIIVGPFVSNADAVTPSTGLADQSGNGRLVKMSTGAAFTAVSWTHDGLGHYAVGLSTAHTDTVGRLRLSFSSPATYCPVWEDFTVLSQAIYDEVFGATGLAANAAAAILVTPANKVRTSAAGTGVLAGSVVIDQSPAVNVRNQDAVTAPTLADALQGAWTEAFARESITGTAYAKRLPDNSAAGRTFTLDSATAPTSRT